MERCLRGLALAVSQNPSATSLSSFIKVPWGIAALVALALPIGAHSAIGPPKRQPTDPWVVHEAMLGRSLLGRPIAIFERGDPTAGRRVLVVGCIHGDENAGIAVADRLRSIPIPPGLDLWVIPSANPDGVARGTRTNGRGVDLNRNFGWRWRPIGRRGDPQYSGTGPLSEPETRVLVQTINRVRPDVTIWFHQPIGVVDFSGGDATIERRFAGLAGMRLLRLPRYAGGVTNWQNANFPGTTAFVVELPAGPLQPSRAVALAQGVVAP
jgi:murein peptide amidase A